MSEDATIEDEIDSEEATASKRPQTESGLLPWSYIFEQAAKQWTFFLLFSIVVGVFLYVSARQRKRDERAAKSISGDHVQSGSQGASRRSLKTD